MGTKKIIRKILKEEEFEWIDDSLPSPRQVLDHVTAESRWVTYIPEISRKIEFYVNPEEWNHMANVRVSKVESGGHGSFGREPHKDFQDSPLDNLYDENRVWYNNNNYIEGGDGNMVNIMDAVKDMKGYSNESAELTIEYKKQIQELTKNYVKSLQQLKSKYNYDSSVDVELVVLDKDGKPHDTDDFERGYPGRSELRFKKPRKL